MFSLRVRIASFTSGGSRCPRGSCPCPTTWRPSDLAGTGEARAVPAVAAARRSSAAPSGPDPSTTSISPMFAPRQLCHESCTAGPSVGGAPVPTTHPDSVRHVFELRKALEDAAHDEMRVPTLHVERSSPAPRAPSTPGPSQYGGEPWPECWLITQIAVLNRRPESIVVGVIERLQPGARPATGGEGAHRLEVRSPRSTSRPRSRRRCRSDGSARCRRARTGASRQKSASHRLCAARCPARACSYSSFGTRRARDVEGRPVEGRNGVGEDHLTDHAVAHEIRQPLAPNPSSSSSCRRDFFVDGIPIPTPPLRRRLVPVASAPDTRRIRVDGGARVGVGRDADIGGRVIDGRQGVFLSTSRRPGVGSTESERAQISTDSRPGPRRRRGGLHDPRLPYGAGLRRASGGRRRARRTPTARCGACASAPSWSR